MCFLKSCLSPAFGGLQITLHPSPRCTPQPSNLPSSTSYPAGSSAIVGPGFALQNSTAQHFASQSNPRDLLHQSLDAEVFQHHSASKGSHCKPQTAGGKAELLLSQQRHFAWWWESSSQHPFGFSHCPLGFSHHFPAPAQQGGVSFHKDLFLTTASLGAGWVSGNSFQRLGVLPGWGHSSGRGRGPAGPR